VAALLEDNPAAGTQQEIEEGLGQRRLLGALEDGVNLIDPSSRGQHSPKVTPRAPAPGSPPTASLASPTPTSRPRG
jgi:hypothetical protein